MPKDEGSSDLKYPVIAAVLNFHHRRASGYPKGQLTDWPLTSGGLPDIPAYREWISKYVPYEPDTIYRWFKGISRPAPEFLDGLAEAFSLDASSGAPAMRQAIWELQVALDTPRVDVWRYDLHQDSKRCKLLSQFPGLVRKHIPRPHGDAEPGVPRDAGAGPSAAQRSALPAYSDIANRLVKLLAQPACDAIRCGLQADLDLAEPLADRTKARTLLEALLATQADKAEERALFAVMRLTESPLQVPASGTDRHTFERALTQTFVLCLMDWMIGASASKEEADITLVRLQERQPLAAAILAEAILGGELWFDRADGTPQALHYINTDVVGILPGKHWEEVVGNVGAHVHAARVRWSPDASQKTSQPLAHAADVRAHLRIERGVRFRHWRLLLVNDPASGAASSLDLATDVARTIDIPLVVVGDNPDDQGPVGAGLLRDRAGRPDRYVSDFLIALDKLISG